jgi:glycosyltransferase involved in cell wall biosynthesis
MRIFMLVPHEGISGPIPKQTLHLAAALRSLGCTIVTHSWGRRSEDERLPGKLARGLRQVRSVRRVLAGGGFDVAVVHTSHDWRTLVRDLALVLSIRGRCPLIVLQLHGSQPSVLIKPGRWVFKLGTGLLLTLVDGVMVLSTEEQAEWRAFRARPSIFTVKNPYVRSPIWAKRPGDGSPEDGHRVLFVGRLLEEKGIFDLVEAFAAVVEQTPCGLVFVGQGEDDRRLREKIHRLGINDHVEIKGYLEGAELGRVYGEATLLALPTSWPEGFPTVLAEAMDAGLPIVTTRIRGAIDHLVEGENALFVEPRDVDGLASALVALLQDRDLRTKMATANRERVHLFDPDLVGAEYLEVLHSLARERAGSARLSQGDRRPEHHRGTTRSR